MQSKGTHGTGLGATGRAKTLRPPPSAQKIGTTATARVISTPIDRELCFGGVLPRNNLLNQCFHLFLHMGIAGTSKQFTEKKLEVNRSMFA